MHRYNWTILNRLLVSFVVIAAISWAWWTTPRPGPAVTQPGGDFTLHSKNGPISLHAFRGKVVLIYFGFTNCPDVCPNTLKKWADVLNKLNPDASDHVQFLFVSVDPQRDTLAWLDTYTSYFHTDIIGISGSFEELKKATELYNVDYKIKPDNDEYSIRHTPFVYVLNPQGKLHTMLNHNSDTDTIIGTVNTALEDT